MRKNTEEILLSYSGWAISPAEDSNLNLTFIRKSIKEQNYWYVVTMNSFHRFIGIAGAKPVTSRELLHSQNGGRGRN